jgi:hypothetical protein
VVGKYVNLKKSISDMYTGLKVYDTIIIKLDALKRTKTNQNETVPLTSNYKFYTRDVDG